MDAHELLHKLAAVNDQIEKAIKALAPHYTTESGADVHEYLRTAGAYLGGIESQLGHELLNKGD